MSSSSSSSNDDDDSGPRHWPRVRWFLERNCAECKCRLLDPMCRTCAYHSVKLLDNEPIGWNEDSDEEDLDCCECNDRTTEPILCDDCIAEKAKTEAEDNKDDEVDGEEKDEEEDEEEDEDEKDNL